jgi:hypothetical protein
MVVGVAGDVPLMRTLHLVGHEQHQRAADLEDAPQRGETFRRRQQVLEDVVADDRVVGGINAVA